VVSGRILEAQKLSKIILNANAGHVCIIKWEKDKWPSPNARFEIDDKKTGEVVSEMVNI